MLASETTFGDRLQRILDERGLTHSDLARAMFGTVTDERGYTVAKNRQVIRRYLTGMSEPSRATKAKMVKALGCRWSDLFPSDDQINMPGSGIVVTPERGGRLKLEVSIVLPKAVAEQVIDLLRDHM